jgi:hypothetical protein
MSKTQKYNEFESVFVLIFSATLKNIGRFGATTQPVAYLHAMFIVQHYNVMALRYEETIPVRRAACALLVAQPTASSGRDNNALSG